MYSVKNNGSLSEIAAVYSLVLYSFYTSIFRVWKQRINQTKCNNLTHSLKQQPLPLLLRAYVKDCLVHHYAEVSAMHTIFDKRVVLDSDTLKLINRKT